MGVHVRDLKGDGKAWIVVYDRRVPKGYLRKYVGDDWKAAKRAASIIRERLAANDLRFLHGRSSAVPSLEEAVGQYLAERLAFQTIDPFTKDNYERTLRKHVFPVLGSVGVTAIQREDLKALFERLLAAKASKSLCRNILAPIKQTYEWLIDDRGLALQNPAVRLGKFLHETIDKKKRVAPLTPQDQAAFLRAARTRPRYFFLFLIALRAGLRLSECFGLQWTDFDLENRTVRIERQFREGKLIDRTKKNKVRLVDLSREIVREFSVHLEWMQRDAAARDRARSPFVFTTTAGGPIRGKSTFTRKVLRPLVALAGLQRRVTFQNFRQTFCTDLVQSAGERGLLYASEQAGHSSINITADYYGRGTSKDKSLVDGLDERVRRAGQLAGSTPRPHHEGPPPSEPSVTPRFTGEPSGDRTRDPLIKSQVLYRSELTAPAVILQGYKPGAT